MSSTPILGPSGSAAVAPASRVAGGRSATGGPGPSSGRPKTDPRTFAERLKRISIVGSVAGFGLIWSLVSANAVGVTARTATPATGTGTDTSGAGGAGTGTGSGAGSNGSVTQPGNGGFFQGAASQPPAFSGGTGSTGAAGSVGATSGSSASQHQLPTVSGFGNFGGPLITSGSS